MRKFIFFAVVALLGTIGLSACNDNGNQANTATEATATTKPTCSGEDPDCLKEWKDYLSHVVEANLGDITNTPYVYFVPDVPVEVAAAGTAAAAGSAAVPASASSAIATLGRVQDQLDTVVAATVLPGNMVAAAGPNSATTAKVLENAFSQASPGSFKGVVVLFIGDQADEAAVKAAVEPSGATFKFAQM